MDAGLDVADRDEAGDHSEQAPQGAFGKVALQSGAEVAAGKPAGAEERAERPVGRDRAAVGGLKHLVGDDPADRGQERRGERRGRDLIGGVPQGEQDRREDRPATDPVDPADGPDQQRKQPDPASSPARRLRSCGREALATEREPEARAAAARRRR